MAGNGNTKSSGGGISFLGLLTILFITLKLTHVVAWSWWLVLLPLWLPILLAVGIFLVAFIYLVVTDKR